MNTLTRFIDKTTVVNGCWLWTAATNGHLGGGGPYGTFRLNGRLRPAHRVSFLMFRGAIPAGHVVSHTCGNALCVNPAHLYTRSRQP